MRPISRRYSAFYTILCTLAVFVTTSCSSRNTTFYSLANEGLIPVSIDNPHVGSNVFLAEEMEQSNYLYSFLKSRGAPQGIEILGTSEKSAELRLYFSDKREMYKATPQFDPQNKSKEWIIKGPYGLDREAYRALQQLHSEHGAVFEIFGKREVLGGVARAAEVRVIAPAFVPTPRPTPRPVRKVTPSAPTTATGPDIGFTGGGSNLDQEALIEALKAKLTTPTAAPAPSQPAAKTGEIAKPTAEKPKAPEKAARPTAPDQGSPVKPVASPASDKQQKENVPSLSDIEKEAKEKKADAKEKP
jgi:hypothetical protein